MPSAITQRLMETEKSTASELRRGRTSPSKTRDFRDDGDDIERWSSSVLGWVVGDYSVDLFIWSIGPVVAGPPAVDLNFVRRFKTRR